MQYRNFYQKWGAMTREQYRRSHSHLRFILEQPLVNFVFLLTIMWYATYKDAFLISGIHSVIFQDLDAKLKAVSDAEISTFWGFLYWFIFEAVLFAAQEFVAIYRTMVNYDKPRNDRAMAVYSWAHLALLFGLFNLVIILISYFIVRVLEHNEYIGGLLASTSLLREGNGLLVLVGLLWEQYVVVVNFEG
jgi:hypothetical protein